jgi:GMP synthase-like glutamine amidotransferase
MKIGILQTGHAPDELRPLHGDYATLFEELLVGQGLSFHTWSVVEMEFPAGPDAADGWLITGSRHGAYEDHPFIAPLEDLIRAIYAAQVPLVGICFGHQIVAQALGGKVEKFAGGWAVGPQVYYWEGAAVTLNAWHQDQVTLRPADARVCASSPFCENAALVYGERAFTVQAHPEFSGDFIDGLIRTRGRGRVPDALLDAAKASLHMPNDNALLADRIAGFLKRGRHAMPLAENPRDDRELAGPAA